MHLWLRQLRHLLIVTYRSLLDHPRMARSSQFSIGESLNLPFSADSINQPRQGTYSCPLFAKYLRTPTVQGLNPVSLTGEESPMQSTPLASVKQPSRPPSRAMVE